MRELTTCVLREPGVKHEKSTERLAVDWRELAPGQPHLALALFLGFQIS